MLNVPSRPTHLNAFVLTKLFTPLAGSDMTHFLSKLFQSDNTLLSALKSSLKKLSYAEGETLDEVN